MEDLDEAVVAYARSEPGKPPRAVAKQFGQPQRSSKPCWPQEELRDDQLDRPA